MHVSQQAVSSGREQQKNLVLDVTSCKTHDRRLVKPEEHLKVRLHSAAL